MAVNENPLTLKPLGGKISGQIARLCEEGWLESRGFYHWCQSSYIFLLILNYRSFPIPKTAQRTYDKIE